MANLNARPDGLLSFLGIKNGGKFPQTLRDDLTGNIDLLRLYEANNVISYGEAVVGDIAFGLTEFGPAGVTTNVGSVFHFDTVEVRVNCTGAGTIIAFQLGLYQPATTTFIGFTPISYGQLAVPAQNWAAIALRDVWVPAGWSLCMNAPQKAGVIPTRLSWLGSEYEF